MNGPTATTVSAAEPLLVEVDPKSVVVNSSSREEEGRGEGEDAPGVTGEQTALGVGGLVEGVAGGDHDEGKPQVTRVSYEVRGDWWVLIQISIRRFPIGESVGPLLGKCFPRRS